MNSDDAQAYLREWLSSTERYRRRLVIHGGSGTGKTDLAMRVARSIEDSVFVDCSGRTADEVLLHVLSALRGNAGPTNDRRDGWRLRDDLTGRPVIVFSNPQWAGTVRTSSEPRRIARHLSLLLSRADRADPRLVIEWDPDFVGVPPARAARIDMPVEGRAELAGTPPPADAEAAHSLRALAAAETERVPLSVWRLLAAALDPTGPVLDPLRVVPRLAPLLQVEGAQGSEVAFFRSPGTAWEWRREPLTSAEHQRIFQALLVEARALTSERPWHEQGGLGAYLARTLPVHSALATGLDEILSDGGLLAHCHPNSLLEALPLAYPEGVPAGSVAADLRHLECQGVISEDQGEWVAWLHHSAVSSGRDDLARQLLSSGIELPWRTVWSRWRPPGLFGAHPEEAGRVDELGVKGESGELAVVTARDATVGKLDEPSHRHVRQHWSLASGEPLTAATVVPASLERADWLGSARTPPDSGFVFARHAEEGWRVQPPGSPLRTLPPRSPVAVTQAVGDGNTWVLSGRGGLFAVRSGVPVSAQAPVWRTGPLVRPHSQRLPKEMPPPARAAAQGIGSRTWLEETFGPGSCHPLAEDEVPEGVSDPVARRFLVDVGVPHLSGFLLLRVRDVAASGLAAVRWPVEASATVDSDGPFYLLGDWMYSQLLLDGSTGRVLRDATGGMSETFVGSSLPQYFALVRLFDEYRRTTYPSEADRYDAEDDLRAWCRAIDPAAQEEVWDEVLTGYPFEDGTWDLATYGFPGGD